MPRILEKKNVGKEKNKLFSLGRNILKRLGILGKRSIRNSCVVGVLSSSISHDFRGFNISPKMRCCVVGLLETPDGLGASVSTDTRFGSLKGFRYGSNHFDERL